MSWNKTTIDGQTMYERSDGVRVSRTQDIEAIERQEQSEMDNWRRNRKMNYPYEDESSPEDEQLNPVGLALVFIMVIALIVMVIVNK